MLHPFWPFISFPLPLPFAAALCSSCQLLGCHPLLFHWPSSQPSSFWLLHCQLGELLCLHLLLPPICLLASLGGLPKNQPLGVGLLLQLQASPWVATCSCCCPCFSQVVEKVLCSLGVTQVSLPLLPFFQGCLCTRLCPFAGPQNYFAFVALLQITSYRVWAKGWKCSLKKNKAGKNAPLAHMLRLPFQVPTPPKIFCTPFACLQLGFAHLCQKPSKYFARLALLQGWPFFRACPFAGLHF